MFLAFAIITLLGALGLLFQRSVIVAGLCLVASFLGVAGIFLTLLNPVAAAFQIIVYSGAIMVLVLFVIMLLNNHNEEKAEKPRRVQQVLSVAVVLALGYGLLSVLARTKALGTMPETAAKVVDLDAVGQTLMQTHLVSLEVIGLLLLAAMVAAVALTRKVF